MLVAITRPTGPELAECELTHIDRVPIDAGLAVRQHAAYVAALGRLGVAVIEVERLPAHPDAVFVEDCAVVVDEVAVMLRPGAVSRTGELDSIATALEEYRDVVWLDRGSIDGGDIVVLDRTVMIGITSRTDPVGAAALSAVLAPFGYEVQKVDVSGCLHLKTAMTAVDRETVVAHGPFVDPARIRARVLLVPGTEPHGANVARVGSTLLVDAAAPRTHEMLVAAGYDVTAVEVGEFAKAEGALTCKSIIFQRAPGSRRMASDAG